MALPEERLQVIIILLLLCRLDILLQKLVPVGEGVSVHNMHVVNTISPSLPEVLDQQVSLLPQCLLINEWIVEK